MQEKSYAITEILKNARKKKEVTQGEAADFLGITQSQYSKIERRPGKARVAGFVKLALWLGVDNGELLEMIKQLAEIA